MKDLVIALIFASCLYGCKDSVATESTDAHHYNLRFERNCLVVSAMLADSTAMEVEFDSGCANGYANIDSATLERISKISSQPTSSNQITLQINGHNLSYRYFINQYPRPLIGLNSKDSLRRWALHLSQHRLDIIPNDSLVDKNRYHALPIRIKHGLFPIVELPITLYKNGQEFSFKRSFLVDTGAPTAFCITDPDDELMRFVNAIPNCRYEDALTATFANQGRLRDHRKFILDSVAVKPFMIGKACCAIDVGVRSARKEFGDDVVGTVGMGVLKNFDIVFDYQNSELLLAAHGQDMPFYEQAESGLGFTYSKKLRVSFVEQNHNAHRAGLQPGDRIHTINAVPLDRLLHQNVMDSLRMLPDNTPIDLQIVRNDTIVEIEYRAFTALK